MLSQLSDNLNIRSKLPIIQPTGYPANNEEMSQRDLENNDLFNNIQE